MTEEDDFSYHSPSMYSTTIFFMFIGCVPGFVSLIGGILLSQLIDKSGRKSAMLTGITFHFIGWLLIFVDQNFGVQILGRMFTGIPSGSYFYPAQVYGRESIAVNEPFFLTIFSGFGIFFTAVGILITFLLALFIDHRQIAAFASILSLTFFILILLLLPESPTWYYLQGRITDAKESERKLRIFQPILYHILDSNPPLPKKSSWYNWRPVNIKEGLQEVMIREDILWPLITITIGGIVMFNTGGKVMLVYLLHILSSEPLESKASPYLTTESYHYGLIVGIIVLISSSFALFALQWVEVKKLAISTAILLCLGYGIVGTASLMKLSKSDLFVVNTIGLGMVVFAYYGGILYFPLSFIAEVFPADAKKFGGLAIIAINFYSSLVIKLHPYLYSYFQGQIYFGYLLMGILYAIFAFYFIPEYRKEEPENIQKESLPTLEENVILLSN